jgi:hypothetical protein
MRNEIEKDQDHTFSWSFHDRNIQEIPVEGTIIVYKNDGTTLVSSTAVSIETDGEIKYTLSASNTTDVACNYKIELQYKVGDVITRDFYLFDIVYTPLNDNTRDEDLFKYVPELRNKYTPYVKETTALGTSSSLISKELEPLNIDFKGGHVDIYVDDTTVHSAEIINWEPALFRASFSPVYTSSIASGVRFRIRSSFQDFIDEAYINTVSRDIRNKIGIKARYIDSTVTRNLTVFKTLEMICFSNVEEEGDKWDIRATKFMNMYKDELTKLYEPADLDDDGNISDEEDASRPSPMNRSISR